MSLTIEKMNCGKKRMAEMTPRVKKLQENLETISDEGVFFERAVLLLEAERAHRNDPNDIKYVRCLQHLLENMTVDIRDDELIVGMCREEILSPEQETAFAQMCRHNNFKATELFTFDPLQIIEITDEDERFAPVWFNSYGHCIPDWARLLEKGFTGIRAEAQQRLEDPALTQAQTAFLQNAVDAAEAMNAFIARYAERAAELAKEKPEDEQKRLAEIESVCRHLSCGGAGSFREAVQLIWFGMFVLQVVCGARDYAYGRLDQILYPYYAQDAAAGRLTREQALELMECLFIKSNEIIGYAWESYKPKRVLCKNSLQYILVSGMREDGSDTTNTVSWIILDAIYELKLKQPTVNVRYHRNIDRDFFRYACRIAASGLGYPSFFNDHVVVEALMANGVSRADAYGYGYYGCNNSFLPGQEDELREAWECGPKLLEYALNSGACMATGRVQGVITPPVYQLRSMDDILQALRLQIRDCIRRTKAHVERSDAYWQELKPFSFESILMTDCISKASSMNADGSRQRHINCHFVGIATLANSLYAIDRLVFRERRFTLPELTELLKSNWEGEEYIQTYIREQYPKFGNDDDAVDRYAEKVGQIYVEEVMAASPTAGGRKLYPSFYSLWHHRAFGKVCAASADGRSAGEAISESQSPVYGTEANGPTAMFNSVAKLPFTKTPSGGINVKFQPRAFHGENGYLNLAAILEGYFRKGGMHTQVNVVDRKTLEDAVAHPEKYRNLLVRVVGYSAYFVSLSPEQQQEMIDRTEV